MASLSMRIEPFVALLDTCVLVPSRLRDLLLELAAILLYECRSSEETLNELHRTIVRSRVKHGDERAIIDARAHTLITNLRTEFSDATVLATEYKAHLELAAHATSDPGDRHVIAAALACEAGIIVTDNSRHFRDGALAPLGLRAVTADEFLTTLFASYPDDVLRAITNQLAVYRRPPVTFDELLAKLDRNVPHFVAQVRPFTAPSQR